MDSIFKTMDCNDVEKKSLAVFQLTYTAIKATIGEDAVRRSTWPPFKTQFLEIYFPESEKIKRENLWN